MNSPVDQIEIVKKSKLAMIALSTRSVVLNVMQIVSRIVLARNLLAADFGAFGILQGLIGSMMFFTDVGLGDILSRKAEGISKEDFASYFFIRLLLSLLMATIFLLIYPLLRSHYGLNFIFSDYAGVIAIFIVLDVLAACPMMLMGHKMEFVKIAKIELSGALVTYVMQIGFSFFLKGPWSFFVGLFFGKLSSVFMSFFLADQIPFPKFQKSFLNQNILRGLFFQTATILPSLQVIITPFILSYYFNVDSIGLIFWIEGLVGIPLALIYNYNRVAFISLSKFSMDKDRLRDIISSFLNPMFFGICMVFGLGAAISRPLVLMIFGIKWINATNYIHLSCISIALYALRYLGLSVLSAVNSPQIRVINEFTQLALTGIMILIFIPFFGIKGYFFATICANLIGLVLMIFSIRKLIDGSVYKRLLASLVSMIISILITFQVKTFEFFQLVPGLIFLVLFVIVSIIFDISVLKEFKRFSKKLKLF